MGLAFWYLRARQNLSSTLLFSHITKEFLTYIWWHRLWSRWISIRNGLDVIFLDLIVTDIDTWWVCDGLDRINKLGGRLANLSLIGASAEHFIYHTLNWRPFPFLCCTTKIIIHNDLSRKSLNCHTWYLLRNREGLVLLWCTNKRRSSIDWLTRHGCEALKLFAILYFCS